MFTRSRVLLLVSAVALGGLLWVGSKGFAPPPAAADEFDVSGPFTHGNLTVFLLHGPDAERSRPVLGLDEALARKCAVVYETGSVNELAVENTSEEDDLLLLSGDIVKGGRQDRVMQATMILPPKSGKVPVRAFCVEQSRWTKRGGEADTHFAGNHATIAGKELKQAVQLEASQEKVWANVRAQQAALSKTVGTAVNSKESPTSLQLALEHERVQAEVAKFREAIVAKVGTPAGAVGFVTVVNGRVTGAEAFGSHAVFQKAWAKAVNAAAVEAVAAKTDHTFTEMTTAGVRTFLARASEAERSRDGREIESMDEVNRNEPVGAPDGWVVQRADSWRVFGTPNDVSSRVVNDDIGTSTVTVRGVEVTDTTVQTELAPGTIRIGARSDITVGNQGRGNITRGNTVRHYYGNPAYQGRAVEDEYRALRTSVQTTGDQLSPQRNQPSPAKTAVVEYREPGNGAVIHKSFLPR